MLRACANVASVSAIRVKRIAVIPGDGIGKEVIPQAVRVIEATGADLALTYFDWGADRYLADKVTVPADGFATLARDFDAILVGAFGDPRVPSNIHAKEILLGMRCKMDLYANVRPVRLMDASLCPLKGIEPNDLDFVVIRENTEGVYGDLGGVFKQGTPDEVAIQEDINTRKGVERIIRYAFEYCANNKKIDGSQPRRAVDLLIIGAVLKRVADDALDTLARVDVFLDRNFVRRSLLEDASEVTVNALGVLANHHAIEVVWFDAFERAKRRIHQTHRPDIGVQVHLAAHAAEDFFGVNVRRHARIAECSDQDGVEIPGQGSEAICRDRNFVGEIAVGSPVEVS